MTDRFRKFGATLLLGLAIFTFSSAAIFAPKTAYAVIPVSTDADAPRITEWILSALKYLGQTALVASVSTALINTVTYATDRLAYDAAVFIASGGNGGDPLFDNRSAEEYFSDYGASVAGEALGAIDDTGILGNFSLCEPNASGVTLAFKFGIQSAFHRPKPACEWNAVQDNWGGFLSDVASMATDPFGKNSLVITKLAEAYNPKSNDLSVGIQLYSDVLNKAQTDAANSTLREMFSGFFKPQTDFITGKVETPAEIIQKRLDATMSASDSIRNQIAVQALGDKEVLLQIAKHAGSVFTNTLLSKITEKVYDGLFGGLDQSSINPFSADSVASSNAEDARQSFRSFLTATPLSVENYSQLQEFSACPSSGKSLYNCVADSSLVTAVSRADSGSALTIADAIEQGLLKSSWPLIPSSDTARDQDPFCYSYGYCHGNLVKLRKARIISTGWELAAESTANTENSPVTLGEVVNAFTTCNDQGELDDSHPWCHLIDPDWVLKYPETQCKAQVYGEQLVASVTDERQDVCVDMPSCIDEDSDGNCTGGYGYCVREENVWRFRGESCPDYYASCTSYEDPNGKSANFLSNTTNSDNCTADSTGCLWYDTQKVDDGTGTFAFPDYTTSAKLAAAESANDIYKNRIYFTAEVADCESTDAGCKELVSRTDGTTLNMIANPSFEKDVDSDGVPDGWISSGSSGTYSTDGTAMLDGSDAVKPGGTSSYSQEGIVLTQGAEYTLSFYAAQATSGISTNAWIALDASTGETVDFTGFALDGDCALYANKNELDFLTSTPVDTDYERFSCTFTVPTLTDRTAEITATVGVMGNALWYDDMQLEQESSASSYHEGYSSSTLDLAYVKVAPTYLGCTGDSATDPAECGNYATVCSEKNVGCSLYTPTNGDPSIAGITDSLDSCPSECVGYDTFKQEPTRYEPEGDFPVYFIPDTADTCPAQAVGCDEFTNIASEATSYFTNLRACLTTDQAAENSTTSDDAAVFYTWEGSDTDGYQLKTWNLVESDLVTMDPYAGSLGTDSAPGSAPCTNWNATATGITCDDDSNGDGNLDTDSASCDEHDDTIKNPDCREFYDANGVIHYRFWSQTVTVSDSCVTYRKTSVTGADTTTQQSNCESSGGYFDTATAECRYYGYADESTTCSEKQSGCREYTGGRSRNSRQAMTEYFEDGDLTNWDAASATDVTLSNESIATDGHSLSSAGESVWTYVGDNAATCTTDGGCAVGPGTLGGTCTVANGEQTCGTLSQELFAGKTYTVSFWAKGTGTLMVGFDTSLSGSGAIDASFFKTAIELDTDWNEYSYGPLDMNSTDYPSFGNGASALVFTPGSTADEFFIDNVVLREGEDNIDVIKDSWVTPASCDETAEGISSPQYMLGCQEYTDQNGDASNEKSFSSLCEESQVGCSAYFLTQESDATTASVYGGNCGTIDGSVATEATSCYYALNSAGTAYDTSSQFLCTIGVGSSSCDFNLDWYVPPTAFTATGSLSPHLSYAASTVVSPADKDVFLVVNSDVECSSDVAGCMEVGLPVFSQDHTAVESWTSTYLMNTPADYATTLCSEKELFCNAWTDKTNTVHYFKDPQNQTCEYRTDVTVDNVKYSGWFKTGTNPAELCATDPTTGEPQYVIGGDTSGIWKNGDADYSNWVGTCLAKYDSCSEFQDLTDLTQKDLYGSADGTSYFYLNNDSLEDNSLPDSQKCNGQVSQKEGCGLFNDSAEPSKTANMSASYVASKHADVLFGGAPNGFADPIDCSDTSTITSTTGASVDLCANRCTYDASAYYDINGSSSSTIEDGSCYDDSDCRPLTSESGETVNGTCETGTRLSNDANIVLKVNRDRECSEWLSCSDAQTTWDERTNSYKTICGDIGLCTQYSTAGNASFCSAWKTDGAATVLDVDTYAQRDVSWYGEEYSGYAIPGELPVDQLTQKDISDPDADTGSDYRLAFVAGSCDEAFGASCSVGYCENTGSPCASTASCGSEGGSCLIGSCYTVSTTVCTSSADCGSTESCLGGVCAKQGSDGVIEDYSQYDKNAACSSGETFYPSVNFKSGTCLRDECVLTPQGSTFDVGDSEAKSCRGYPEINSPFPNVVVTDWMSAADRTSSDESLGAIPTAYRTGFDNAKTCLAGEDCDCSYTKATYGSKVLYVGTDGSFQPSFTSLIDLCVGGENDGEFCTSDSDTDADATLGYVHSEAHCEAGGGTCTKVSKIDEVLGMDGYCLEHDSSTNILGDRKENACITWLPVDQLAGSTDLYGKYTSAGYFAETEYCASVAPFADLNPTSAEHGTDFTFAGGAKMLCAEANAIDIPSDQWCTGSVSCPPGYFSVQGPRSEGSAAYDNTYSATCNNGADADCPYVCVPVGAIDDAGYCDGGVEPVGIAKDYHIDTYADAGGWKFDRYLIKDPSDFTTYADNVQDCTVKGRQLGDGTTSLRTFGSNWNDYTVAASEDATYGSLNSNANIFIGCAETAVVMADTNDNGAAPYTDRLLNKTNYESTDAPFAAQVGAGFENFAYNPDSPRAPFGRTISTETLERPPVVASCYTTESDYLGTTGLNYYVFSAPNLDVSSTTHDSSCASGSADDNNGADFTNPESRAFTDFALGISRYADGNNGTTTGGTVGFVSGTASWTDIATGAADSGSGWSGIVKDFFARADYGRLYSDGVYNASTGGYEYAETDSTGTPQNDAFGVAGFTKTVDTTWDERIANGKAPSVWAVDMNNCYNDECEEDQSHSLTLNDQNDGDVTGDSFYRAYLKFYAAADKNQLPLRRIIVDWGDGADVTGSVTTDNFYKNHRGLQDGKEVSICDTATTDSTYEWGMNADSCDANYFSYNHIYTCNPSKVTTACADTDSDGIYDNAPCTTNPGVSCTYRPRVHIRDNWGFCTGTCDATDSSYNADGTSSCFDNDGKFDDDPKTSDECNYKEYPNSDSADKLATDPWVYYDGVITVTP